MTRLKTTVICAKTAPGWQMLNAHSVDGAVFCQHRNNTISGLPHHMYRYGTYWFAFKRNSEISILGNVLLQGICMPFDIRTLRVGTVLTDVSNLVYKFMLMSICLRKVV